MGRTQIVNKLDTFLANKIRLEEESDILYLLAETRKILEHMDTNDYPILKFYCHWALHTSKDRITKEMKEIISNLNDDIVYEITKGWPPERRKVTSFMYMEELKEELIKFLNDYELPVDITEEKSWVEFISTFVNVLSDQPIIATPPIKNIKSINILPTSRGFVICQIVFEDEINGYSHFDYKNVYL